jgi:AAA+ superfamily predicted ATPase
VSDLFEETIELPNLPAQRRYAELVGLEEIKVHLEREAAMLLKPALLEEWSKRQHGGKLIRAAELLLNRAPFIIFGGDVGTGKTTLAETFGDAIARAHKVDVRVYRLSLQARGSGQVGEMTTLVSEAFDEVRANATKGKGVGHILIIDEADALAQSRDLHQMHHEDRAGVNALIRGLDQLAVDRLPVLIVMCTNRMSSLDPAVRRRAAAEFTFSRPNDIQRSELLRSLLAGTKITADQIAELVRLTGPVNGRDYGYTYSDLVNKVVPAGVIAAYPDRPLTADGITAALANHPPTRPFAADG